MRFYCADDYFADEENHKPGDAGTESFLRAGRAAFARCSLCRDDAGNPLYQTVDNFGWLDPEYGGWETLTAGIETEPFHITSQTPDPDPSMYVD